MTWPSVRPRRISTAAKLSPALGGFSNSALQAGSSSNLLQKGRNPESMKECSLCHKVETLSVFSWFLKSLAVHASFAHPSFRITSRLPDNLIGRAAQVFDPKTIGTIETAETFGTG